MYKTKNGKIVYFFNNKSIKDIASENEILKKRDHGIKSGYGVWLSEVTDVIPWDPGNARLWTSLSEKEMMDLCDKKKISHELADVEDGVPVETVMRRLLDDWQSKGLFEGFLLPFEATKPTLETGQKFSLKNLYLNYGKNGKGGQRCPKKRHILNMIRQWDPNKLTSGLARVDSQGRVFINEGQQRTLAGAILGRTEFPFDVIYSDDPLVDTFQFIGENQNKLQASEAEIIYSNATSIEENLQRIFEDKSLQEEIKVEDAFTELGIDPKSDPYKHWKIYKFLEQEGITIYNKGNEKENEPKALTNVSQLSDIFDTYPDHIIRDALHLNSLTWPLRTTETADLIGWCEILSYNEKMIYEEIDEDDREAVFSKFKRAIKLCWVDGKSRTVKNIWRDIQDQRKELFPNKLIEDKTSNAKYYGVASRRIAQHLWIAQAFHSVLTQTLKTLKNGNELAEKLIQPYSLPSNEEDGDQGGQTIPFEITWGIKK